MIFDFTNYTFSGLLSILASLYGVGYPLIVQSIGRIFNQYNSALLSRRFAKEPVYKAFQVLMIVNMVAAVLAPFILQAGWMNQLVITIQAIGIVLLIGCSIMLFKLILLYSNAEELLKRVEGGRIDKNNVMELLDLAIYADGQHNLDLYIKSLSGVFSYINQQQGDQPNQNIQTVNPPVFYDGVTINIVTKVKEFIRIDDGHHFLYGNNDITPSLYNQISASRISLQAHKLVWMLVNEAVEYGNHSWFNQYWQYTDSYVTMKYRFVAHNSPLRQDSQIFMIRHIMIGGMLLHYGRAKWLNDVLFFTHSEPEYFGLIPSRFGEIVMYLELVDKMCDDIRYFYQQGFYYHDQMSGVKDSKYFFRDALKYLSLLVIRLWSLEGRGFRKDELFSLPASPLKLEDDERDATMMEMMQKEVTQWFDSDVFGVVPRLTKVDKKKVLSLLGEYQRQCVHDKKSKEEHPTVNQQKYKELIKELEDEAERLGTILPSCEPYNGGMSITMDVFKSSALETINYSGFKDIDCRCIPNVFGTNFWNEIAMDYLRCLGRQKKVGDFSVSRKQIPNVLQAMGMSDDYAIISTEKIEELGDVAVVLNALLTVKWFMVVKKNELPRTQLLNVDEKNFTPIKDESPICSNIVLFQSFNDPIFEFVFATKFVFSIPNGFTGYVRFTVDDDHSAQDVIITPKKTLDDLFV